ARRTRTGDAAELHRRLIPVRIAQVGVIEDIENLPAELQLVPLRDGEILYSAEIQILAEHPAHNITARIAECARAILRERRDIEGLLDDVVLRATPRNVPVAHYVRPVLVYRRCGIVFPRRDGERRVALHRRDPVDLPSAERFLNQTV